MDGNYKYLQRIDDAYTTSVVIINTKDFLNSNVETGLELNDIFLYQPIRFLKGVKRAIQEIFQIRYDSRNISILIDGSDREITIIEALSKKYINQIVSIKGIISYKSKIFNRPNKITYICKDQHKTIITNEKNFSVKEPIVCDNPNCKIRQFEPFIEPDDYETFRTIAVKSDDDFSFTDDEIIIELSGELCELVEAGDRIQLTGLINTSSDKSGKVYTNYIQCLYIRKLDDLDLNITQDDEEIFKKMIDETDFYYRMINSIAPNILGNEEVKESLLLQLIRSPNRRKDDGTIIRGWFNVGLWGDPGVAKTAITEHIEANYPKTQIISSKGATDVGLTLGIDQDSNGHKVLRAGAFVLNRTYGTVIIDEFPRLNPEVIDGIYTTIENGFASIAKAGFQAKQRADSSLLATGNAFSEDWNENLNLKDNLNISTPLLQRFDYHWIFKDSPNEQRDNDIADAILSGVTHEDCFKPYSSSMLVKYFKYVRQFEPELSDDVVKYLKKTYIELRQDEKAKQNGISPRHLNTMIRTTLAISRLYQRNFSTIEDAEKAISLMKKNLKQRGMSISEADTYTNRQYNRCIKILKDASSMGMTIEELFEKLHTTGSKEEIDISILDLGTESKTKHNHKWRNVVGMLRRSTGIIRIISEKPMILAYKHEKRN